MKLLPIKNGVAVEISDIDISQLTDENALDILDALHKYLVVVFKNQPKNPWDFTRLIERIAPIANRFQFRWHTNGDDYHDPVPSCLDWTGAKEDYPVQRVSGMKRGKEFTGIFGAGKLDWHANLNGLNRADGVALQGWEGCVNTSTSFLNTNIAYNDLPIEFKQELLGVHCEYEYAPEVWAPGAPEDQLKRMIENGANKYKMWLMQENIKGVKGIYFYTNNRCKIITEDDTLYKRLYNHMFQDKYIYQHWWEPGDIVLMDQLLTLHKRDQDDPEVLSKRVLNRVTFAISNTNGWLEQRNQIGDA